MGVRVRWYNREVFLDPSKIIEFLKVPFGGKVGDFGAGAGHYTRAALNKLEGSGAVYALDALSSSLDSLMRDAWKMNARLYALRADLNEHIPLKNGLLNAGIAANVLHQISNRPRFVEEIRRVMTPSGEVLVVDWMSSFKNMGPVPSSVLTPSEAAGLFKDAGFSVGEMLPAGAHHFAFIARNT